MTDPAARDPQPEDVEVQALARHSHDMIAPAPGVYALAELSDADFAERLAMLTKGRDRVRQVQRALMVKDVHYGKVPGTDKDTLLKGGQEVLCKLYNYVPDLVVNVEYGDPDNRESPAIRVRVRCEVHAGSLDGPVVGVGYGAANSWETKYRWRQARRECPECHKAALVKSKFPPRHNKNLPPGWWCNSKGTAGGCGTDFAADDPRITSQATGRAENEDAQELENTLVKMASKRAKVDGTLSATATSDLFSQDVGDDETLGATEAARRDGAGPPAVSGGSRDTGTVAGEPASTASDTVSAPASLSEVACETCGGGNPECPRCGGTAERAPTAHEQRAWKAGAASDKAKAKPDDVGAARRAFFAAAAFYGIETDEQKAGWFAKASGQTAANDELHKRGVSAKDRAAAAIRGWCGMILERPVPTRADLTAAEWEECTRELRRAAGPPEDGAEMDRALGTGASGEAPAATSSDDWRTPLLMGCEAAKLKFERLHPGRIVMKRIPDHGAAPWFLVSTDVLKRVNGAAATINLNTCDRTTLTRCYEAIEAECAAVAAVAGGKP